MGMVDRCSLTIYTTNDTSQLHLAHICPVLLPYRVKSSIFNFVAELRDIDYDSDLETHEDGHRSR